MGFGRSLCTVAITGSLLVGIVTSCSSDDDEDAADTALGRALTEQLLSGAAVNTEQEARCVAGTTVDEEPAACLSENLPDAALRDDRRTRSVVSCEAAPID